MCPVQSLLHIHRHNSQKGSFELEPLLSRKATRAFDEAAELDNAADASRLVATRLRFRFGGNFVLAAPVYRGPPNHFPYEGMWTTPKSSGPMRS